MTTWTDYIHGDPAILASKPVVKGTRLAVDFILELFGNGWTQDEVLKSYPQLSPESLQACFAYASEVIAEYRSAVIPSEARNPSNCEPNL